MLCAAVALDRPGDVGDLDLAPANIPQPLGPHRHANLNRPLLSSEPSNHNHQCNYCENDKHFHYRLLQAC
jgi:hypothetical protein